MVPFTFFDQNLSCDEETEEDEDEEVKGRVW